MASKVKKIAIIGSGPSGAIAAQYLIEKGYFVDLYDVGVEFNGASHNVFNDKLTKLHKGSDFMYRLKDDYSFNFDNNTKFFSSHAKGGLSNVWGATVSSLSISDQLYWGPLSQELNINLSEIFNIMGVSSEMDTVDFIDNLKYKSESRIFLNNQTRNIYDHSLVNQDKLHHAKIYVNKAKLAINILQENSDKSCILCNKCMNGCDSNSIFNSSDIISRLKLNPRFNYKQHNLVKSVVESDEGVALNFQDLTSSKEMISEKYLCLLMGAGCIESLKILHNSNYVDIENIEALDSQKYYFPVLMREKFNGAGTISLSHLYIRSFDKNNNAIHMQLYPGMPHIESLIKSKFGIFSNAILWMMSGIINRTLIGCVYLNSNVSGKIKFNFSKKIINITSLPNKESDTVFNGFVDCLNRQRKSLNFYIPRIRLKSKIGHSQHFGGTLPLNLNATSEKNSTDLDGRLNGAKHIYLIDSSVLPNIPATPTTALVCANALRIAKIISLKNYIQ
jgi:hypothetical protein